MEQEEQEESESSISPIPPLERTKNSKPKKSVITVSKLSAFLGRCAVGQVSCRSDEREAFVVVSQAKR